MAYALSPDHHGRRFILDEAGQPVASVYYDPRASEWCVTAECDRYPTRASLPAVFEGRFAHSFSKCGDFLRFFGLPLTLAATLLPSHQKAA